MGNSNSKKVEKGCNPQSSVEPVKNETKKKEENVVSSSPPFKLTLEMIESVPTISSLSNTTFALNEEGF